MWAAGALLWESHRCLGHYGSCMPGEASYLKLDTPPRTLADWEDRALQQRHRRPPGMLGPKHCRHLNRPCTCSRTLCPNSCSMHYVLHPVRAIRASARHQPAIRAAAPGTRSALQRRPQNAGGTRRIPGTATRTGAGESLAHVHLRQREALSGVSRLRKMRRARKSLLASRRFPPATVQGRGRTTEVQPHAPGIGIPGATAPIAWAQRALLRSRARA